MKFSGVSWTRDGKGFFYSRYDEPKSDTLKGTNYFQKVYYHKLGTPQSEDVLVYERPDQKDWLFGGTVTEDGNYLIITVFQGTDVKESCLLQRSQSERSSSREAARRFRRCLQLRRQ